MPARECDRNNRPFIISRDGGAPASNTLTHSFAYRAVSTA